MKPTYEELERAFEKAVEDSSSTIVTLDQQVKQLKTELERCKADKPCLKACNNLTKIMTLEAMLREVYTETSGDWKQWLVDKVKATLEI